MAKEKKPVKDPNKNQKKRSKKVGHKLYEKVFLVQGREVARRRKKHPRSFNENERDWGKMTPPLRELSQTIRRFDGRKVQLDHEDMVISLSEA